jgi:hypothetical protein
MIEFAAVGWLRLYAVAKSPIMIGYARSEANCRGQAFRNPNHSKLGMDLANYRHPSEAAFRTTAPALALIPLPENCRIGVAWSFVEAGGADALGWDCQRNSEVQRFCWLFLAVI